MRAICFVVFASVIVSPVFSGDAKVEEVRYEPHNGCHKLEDRTEGYQWVGNPDPYKAKGNDFNRRYCAFPTDGPGWTVIQFRRRGTTFNKSWHEFKFGVGDVESGDYWFGNRHVWTLTDTSDYMLRVELEDEDFQEYWAEYSMFRIHVGTYDLEISGYRGNAGDALSYLHESRFITPDTPYSVTDKCKSFAKVGWWYHTSCEGNVVNLNESEVKWGHNLGNKTIISTRMLIRPRSVK